MGSRKAPKREKTRSVCFDLANDPLELSPIRRGKKNEVCRDEEYAELMAWQRSMQELGERLGSNESLKFSPEEAEQLRALGYTVD